MIQLAGDAAVGLLVNTVYDLARFAGIRFLNRGENRNPKGLREIVEKKIYESFPDELNQLFESSTFVSYFNSPQFLDVVNTYIEHKTICDITCGNAKVQKLIKKGGIIAAKDIVHYISENIYALYIKHKVLTIPPRSKIEAAVDYILRVTEETVASRLSPENSQMLFLLNSRADMYQEQIMEILSGLQTTVNQIQEKQLSPKHDEYEELRTKYHAILKEKNSIAHIYLLDKFPFERFYVPPVLHRSSVEREKMNLYDLNRYAQSPTAWKDIFATSNIVYLTGGAGYGKSLFTKKIINNYTDLSIFHSSEYLVICGELKSFYPSGAETAISVIDFLKASVRSNTLMDVSGEFIEHYLNAGRCIILLDALDEVEKTKRVNLHETVVAFFKNQNPNNKICITSRDRGFIPEQNVEVLKICPLNEEQIEKYVDKIIALKKFEQEDKESFMNQSKVLVDKGFLNSFLVLSLLINIYKAERELPENKLELYQKCFEYIANKREKDKTQKEFDWRAISPIMKDNTFIELSRMALPNNSNIDKEDIKNRLLQVYKAKYSSEAEAENAIDEFLKFCSDRTELFVPTTEEKFKFFHRSFFEYFYSFYIFLRCKDEHEMLNELMNFDVDSEVFELTVAMLKQKSEMKYQVLIELMFERADTELTTNTCDFPVLNILVLTMQVIDDALYRKRFLELVVNNKRTILNNMDRIHNLKLVATIYENDVEAYRKICNSYESEGKRDLFESCDGLFKLAEEFEKENKLSFFEYALAPQKSLAIRRRFAYHYVDLDEKFYMLILAKVWDCKKILLETDDEGIAGTLKKFYPRNYKKRVVNTRTAIEKLRQFSEEKQDEIVRFMLSYVQVY